VLGFVRHVEGAAQGILVVVSRYKVVWASRLSMRFLGGQRGIIA
jgi:hypothetical protein